MPQQLIYTSAPRGIVAGRSGHCTVARSALMREALMLQLEKFCYYQHLSLSGGQERPIFSCRIVDIRGTRSDLSRNEADINWTIGDNDIAEPIPGKGLDPNAVAPYFSSLSGNDVYVAFLVFEDSFPAFIRAKESAVASGISYGWEPFRNEDSPVSFGETGSTPKPQ